MADQNVKLIISAIDQTRAAFDSLKNNLSRSTSMLRELSVVFGGLSAGVVIQKIAGAFISYNRILETSKLGLAAIYTSMTDITDAEGKTLQGMEKFRAAQGMAVRAQQELQKIAMTTPATFQELVEVYQGVAAPALSAKMTFQETLEITGLLTNAVKSIGLPINQIKQEARDLIQGGIQPASSSLAVALGISDSMVKKWREQGEVFSELKVRLEGFVYASNEFSNKWEGAWSNLKDISQKALGEGLAPLFEALKQEITLISEKMVDIKRNSKGNIISMEIKPEIKQRLSEITAALLDFFRVIKDGTIWLVDFLKEWGQFILIAASAKKFYNLGQSILTVATSLRAVQIAAAGANAALIKGPIGLLLAGFGLATGQLIKEHIESKSLATYKSNVDEELKKTGAVFNASADLYEPLLRLHSNLAFDPKATAELIKRGVIAIGDDGFIKIPTKAEVDAFMAERAAANEAAYQGLGIKGKPQPLSDEAKKAAEGVKKLMRDWQTEAEKGVDSSDKWADKLLDVKNKYEDAMQKLGEMKGKESDKKLLTGYYEAIVSNIGRERTKEAEADWREYTEKMAEQDAKIQEEITEKQSSELDKRLAAEDAWAIKMANLLGERGLDAEEFEAGWTEITRIAEKNKQKIRDDARMQELEAQTRHTLAMLDLAEKEMSMSRGDVASGRLAEYKRVIEYYEQMRTSAIERNDLTGQLTAESKIDETRSKIADLTIEVERLTGSFTDGWQRGLREYMYNLQTTFETAQQIAKETATAMQQAFSDFFFDAFEGNLKNLSDYLNSFLSSVKRAVANALGQQVTGAIMGLFAGGTTGPGSGVSGISGNMFGDWTGGLGFHKGGMATEPTFYRLIPKFHAGVGPDEVLSIIRKDEGVFTPGQMKALGNAASPQIHINFKVDNQANAEIKQGETDMRFDGTSWWVDTAIKVMRSKPDMRQLFATGGKT